MFKNIAIYSTLAVSLLTNIFLVTIVLQRLPAAPPAVVGAKAPLVPTVQVSKAAPPIHVNVPMPKPKPQHVQVEQAEKKVAQKAPVKKKVKKKVPAAPTGSDPKFTCAQLPSWITSISPATIRQGGLDRGYSPAVLDKVIACRKAMGGSG